MVIQKTLPHIVDPCAKTCVKERYILILRSLKSISYKLPNQQIIFKAFSGQKCLKNRYKGSKSITKILSNNELLWQKTG